MNKNNKTSLISGDQWMSSLKNLGITTKDAVCELVDNSLDANAENIHISVIDIGKNKITMIVEDDGSGIPKENVNTVLAFGGRLPSKRRSTIGRFGWGLSSSITCQTNRGELYSKIKGSKDYYFCYIDLQELMDEYKEQSPFLPDTQVKDPFNEYDLNLDKGSHGTVVVLKDCNKKDLQWHSKDKIISELKRTLGETYRKHISAGINISINDQPIKLIDPLLLMQNSAFGNKYEESKHYTDLEILIPEVEDPDTKEAAKIRVRLAIVQPSVSKIKKRDKEVLIGMGNQGFYLMRHDRQIARALTLGIYTRNAHFNFFRGEISFPACLDSYFGIQTNKSRFSLKEGLKDKFVDSMKGIKDGMQAEYNAARTKLEAMLEKHKIKESERIAAEAVKVMKKPNFDLPKSVIEKNEENRLKEKEDDLQRVELDKELKPEEKEILKKEIENDFQTRMPFKVRLKFIETGDFYVVHPVGNNEVEISLNTAHPFYLKVYEKAQEKGMSKYLDLLIFTLAKAEMDFWNVPDVKQFYSQQKSTWSALLAAFLDYSD